MSSPKSSPSSSAPKSSSSPSGPPPSNNKTPPSANNNNNNNQGGNKNGGNNNNAGNNNGGNNNNAANNNGGKNNNNNAGANNGGNKNGGNNNNQGGNDNGGNNNKNNNKTPNANGANNNNGSGQQQQPGANNKPTTPVVPTPANTKSPPSPTKPGALTPPHKSSSHSSRGGGGGESNSNRAIIAGVVAGAGLMFIIMIICMVCCFRKKKKRDPREQYYRGPTKNHNEYYNYDNHYKTSPPGGQSAEYGGWGAPPPPPPGMTNTGDSANYSAAYPPAIPPPHPLTLGINQSTFSYEELNAATRGFSKENLLGQGGFGYVHKGVLPSGKEIAVKSLKSGSGQGEREFQAEVDIISRVHHRHLVSLVGYCITGSSRMLVYEFVANDTLEFHLHVKANPVMDWPSRLRIALGAAKGFAYLHEDCHPRIIHRDIKASNILLDEHFEAKVADFGLAKLSNDTNTHVSTRIMGTFGYLAPEYASSGKLTEKSDVYSYGVVLLELITGRRPVDYNSDDEDTLIDWARPILMSASEGGSYEELVDQRLVHNYNPAEMLRMVASAAACVRHSARRRPKMSQIVRALEGDVSLENLHEGVKPGQSAMYGSGGNTEHDGQSYDADIKKFRQIAFASSEFSSGEHGARSDCSHSSGGESQEMPKRKL